MTIVEKEQCCACRACMLVCPQGAISFENDEYGFEQVKINEGKCVACGKCKKVCPILNYDKIEKHGALECGSAYALDSNIRHDCSSGGMFGVFSEFVINNHGVVYGAAFDSNISLITRRIDNKKELGLLYKSKYLLCNTKDSFQSIKNDLESGKNVLYCSTPCQIAALNRYLDCLYDNLLCVEFVCHGVGGQNQFDQSIRYIEEKKQIKIFEYRFREKAGNSSSHYYYFRYKDKDGKEGVRSDIFMTFPYYYAYCNRLTCREICYNCPYATEERVADITIGDFHSINKYETKVDRFKGVSMYVCNTEKGAAFFSRIRGNLVVKPYNIEVLYSNNRFSREEIKPKNREGYLDALKKYPYDQVVNKYLSYRRDWRYYYYKLPRFIRVLGRIILRRM